MNSYIKAIILFNKKGVKRGFELKEGLNIITGQSKSGKSALLEIIDYCFGSSSSTIPKGKITDFTYLYSIILNVKGLNVVIGRKSFREGGRSHMFLKVDKKEINYNSLSLGYYQENEFIQRKRVIREIENLLGLTVTDSSEGEEQAKEGRPSIRNMMSYLLQHQNLVASKFALFYRFDDSRKRDQVIKQFPVFSGWVDQRYYSYKYRLDGLLRLQKNKEKELINNRKYLEKKKDTLLETFSNYFMLIGEELNQHLSIDELLDIRNNLPTLDEEKGYINKKIKTRYMQLKEELEQKTRQKHKLELVITNLEESEKYGKKYLGNLGKLKRKADVSKPKKQNYICPLCGNEHININNEVTEVLESIDWLERELSDVDYHKNSYGDEIRKHQEHIDKIEVDIKNIINNLKEIEEMNKEILNGRPFNEQVIYAKAKIDLEVDMFLNSTKFLNEEDLESIKHQVQDLQERVLAYDLKTHYAEAKTFINKHINKIVNKLDFEEEFKPSKIVFDLEETFDLYHRDIKTDSRIYLSEMGSGANWLACHLGLFLSLIRYFCKQSNSSIPKFLFFDQPSQVYFPDTTVTDGTQDRNKDIIAVKNIYESILDEIEDIYLDTGIRPQIIVTDHVKGLPMEKYGFKNYIRASWFDTKLI